MQGYFRIFLVVIFTAFAANVSAQQTMWLQIEAQPTLSAARERASAYASRIENVAGFRLGRTNWHAVVIGPFDAETAENRRASLRSQGLIPSDSFTSDGASYGERFWPIGAGSAPLPEAPAEAAPATPQTPVETLEPVVPAPPLDESPAEARRSETLLTLGQRRELQTALQWEGVYNAAIDGAFGRGTRAAMRDWQIAKGYEPTGILTTRQRQALLTAYNAILQGLGMEQVRDDVAGIEITLPLELVGFDRYEPPFAHYGPNKMDDKVPKVLLISQKGDVNTLFGLYDIMQTLEIVPEDGAREKRNNSFTLIGEGDDFISQTEATVRDGAVKGFTLIWPKGDEKRRQRVLDEMTESFVALPGIVMDDLVGDPTEDQRIDLLAGLEIRRPERTRSGFYVDPRGTVLTTAGTLGACERITLNEEIEAELMAVDNSTGLALLSPKQALAPRSFAHFQPAVPRLQSDVVLAGYSYGGILGAPSLSFGSLADLRGLNGEETVKRLALGTRPGDEGGPVLDVSGAVLGMLVPGAPSDGHALPDDVSFAVDVETIARFMSNNGINASAAERGPALRAGILADRAKDMTVLVGCWE